MACLKLNIPEEKSTALKVVHKSLRDNENSCSGAYRFGYQGSEKDDEINGTGNTYTTYFRQLDTRLGRWWSPDVVTIPWQSPYCSMDNNPIMFIDPLGAEGKKFFTETKAGRWLNPGTKVSGGGRTTFQKAFNKAPSGYKMVDGNKQSRNFYAQNTRPNLPSVLKGTFTDRFNLSDFRSGSQDINSWVQSMQSQRYQLDNVNFTQFYTSYGKQESGKNLFSDPSYGVSHTLELDGNPLAVDVFGDWSGNVPISSYVQKSLIKINASPTLTSETRMIGTLVHTGVVGVNLARNYNAIKLTPIMRDPNYQVSSFTISMKHYRQMKIIYGNEDLFTIEAKGKYFDIR